MSPNVIQFPRRRIPQGEDDYRQRMRANLAAVAFLTIFLLGACWVFDTLLSIPARVDCNFSVRRPCNVNFNASSASLAGDAF
jgi:hypothetical protein